MMGLLQKDAPFFDELFRQYYKALRACAFRYVSDINTAEDIVQDVFFELWLKRDKIDITAHIKPYLFKAVFNRSINYLKSKEGKEKVSLEPQHETQIQDYYLSSLTTDIEDSLLLKELNEEIKSCVEKLPEQCKRIFILRHNYSMKNREIAEQLNISIKAVEKQISKALYKIRLHLLKLNLLPFVVYVILKNM